MPAWKSVLVAVVCALLLAVLVIGGGALYVLQAIKADLDGHPAEQNLPEGMALESHSYRGEITWRDHAIPISYRSVGTLNNDKDHDVSLIEGPDLMVQVVWGLAVSGTKAKYGKEAEVSHSKMPQGWPSPIRFIVDQRFPTYLRGRLTLRAESKAITSRADPAMDNTMAIVLKPEPMAH